MKKYTIVLLFLSAAVKLSGQSIFDGNNLFNTSLDVSTNAQSIGMGESFVANNDNITSFFENPAALYFGKNVSVFYNYRSQGWMDLVKDYFFASYGATAKTSIGSFGAGVNLFSSGEYQTGLPGAYEKSIDRDRTFILSYATPFWNNLSIGVSTKFFSHDQTSNGTPKNQITSNTAVLADAGILYEFDSFIKNDVARDYLNLGVSVQNIGTKYRETYSFLNEETLDVKLPQYLRAGFSYEMNLLLGKSKRTNVDILLTGEYKNLLNPGPDEMTDVDYWGFGIETTLFNSLSLRAGTLKSPQNNILFDKNKFTWRYGAGINMPIGLLGFHYPLMLRFDYSVIPVNQFDLNVTDPSNPEGSGAPLKSRNHLYAFGLSLSYTLK